MIDLHSHILFDLDDGPATVEESLDLARAAVGAGTATMVATPHVDSHWDVEPAAIIQRTVELKRELELAGIELALLTGAEVAIDRYLDLSPDQLQILTLGLGPYLLLESPFSPADGNIELAVRSALNSGQKVLLAHPERCPTFQRRPDTLRELVATGVLCQITAGSLSGRFGRTVRRFSIELLREGLVHDLASDAHDAERRPPQLADALLGLHRELPGIEAQVDWLTRDAPAAILAGSPLPPRPNLAASSHRWRFR